MESQRASAVAGRIKQISVTVELNELLLMTNRGTESLLVTPSSQSLCIVTYHVVKWKTARTHTLIHCTAEL